ncbi:MAG: ImmA/IrrE family metallo-endopeptidase [Anaerolineales bacterium]|nr:ImmA/IrrE family metallo-endopeptidase [Anaerolineales bacterium]
MESADDVSRFANFLREEAGLTVDPPIDLIKIYDRFDMPTPVRASLPSGQGLLLNPDVGLIILNEEDPILRQRFTEAHELIELLFAALPEGRGWAARQTGPFKHNTKERLCNAGAAELLMPQASFLPRVEHQGVLFQTARNLAPEFEVSLTAALVRIAQVGPGRHAVVLWRIKNKPIEIRHKIPTNQLPLFDFAPTNLPPKKLRVEWSLGAPRTSYIPPDKSVPEDSSIYTAWRDGAFTVGEEHLDLGSVSGHFKCESQPFDSEGERMVLSLLHLPGDAQCGFHG